jgi:hypothetical protein
MIAPKGLRFEAAAEGGGITRSPFFGFFLWRDKERN